MLGFFGPRYGRSPAVMLSGNLVRKRTDPSLCETEAQMTRLAHALGLDTGAFRSPWVLRSDLSAGIIELEHLPELRTIGQVIREQEDCLELMYRVGGVLAIIHGHLDVPPAFRRPVRLPCHLPRHPAAAIHGDFNTMNVCCDASGAIVVLDWACAKPFGAGSTIGPRYLDLATFLRSLAVHQASLLCAMRHYRDRAMALIEGYHGQWGRSLDLSVLGQFLLAVNSILRRHPASCGDLWQNVPYHLAGIVAHRLFAGIARSWQKGGRQRLHTKAEAA